jgi:hypothetical protein
MSMKQTKEYITKNPYYHYKYIMDSILSDKSIDFKQSISWASYYCQDIHNLCNCIYQNLHDREKCKEYGVQIHQKIGFDGLQSVYYIILRYSPTSISIDSDIRAIPVNLNYYFDGIGNWES